METRTQTRLPYGDFKAFRGQHGWLGGYSPFSALKEHFGGKPRAGMANQVRSFASAKRSSISPPSLRAPKRMNLYNTFFSRNGRRSDRAADLNIAIIGDAPIFAAVDSSDVWANPELFQLDRKTELRPPPLWLLPRRIISRHGWPNSGAIRTMTWPAKPPMDTRGGSPRYCGPISRSVILLWIRSFPGLRTYWSIPAMRLMLERPLGTGTRLCDLRGHQSGQCQMRN